MKKILLIAGLLGYLAPTQANAQISVNEDFEITNEAQINFLPSGWTKEGTFERSKSMKCSGQVGIGAFLTLLDTYAILTTPNYTSDGNPAKLKFSYQIGDENTPNDDITGSNFSLKLEYSTDNGATWITKENLSLLEIFLAASSCRTKQVAFTGAELPAGQAKFRFVADINGNGFIKVALDDVVIEQNAELSTNNYELTNVTIFPNPVADFINIAAEEKIDAISIFDINGKRIHYIEVNNFNSKINVKHLASGTYFISVKAGEKTSTEQVIIK